MSSHPAHISPYAPTHAILSHPIGDGQMKTKGDEELID